MSVSTPTKSQTDLSVIKEMRTGLITARCREAQASERLNKAIRSAREQQGASIENLSEASGLRTEIVKDLLRSPDRSEENLAVLAGLG